MRDATLGCPAQEARVAAGLSLRQAAARARLSERYLRHVELHGAPYALAVRLAALYRCPIQYFLPRATGRSPRGDREDGVAPGPRKMQHAARQVRH